MAGPSFSWEGSVESKEGTALYKCGMQVFEITLDDFATAHRLFQFIEDTFTIGHNDGTEEMARAVRKTVGEVSQDGL